MEENNAENLDDIVTGAFGTKVVAKIITLQWTCKCGKVNTSSSKEFADGKPNGNESFVAGTDGYSTPCLACNEMSLLNIPIHEEAVIFGKQHAVGLLDCVENIDRRNHGATIGTLLDILSHGLGFVRQKRYSVIKDEKPWLSNIYITHKDRPEK